MTEDIITYKTYILPDGLIYHPEWTHWLNEYRISALWNSNWNYIIFDFPEDLVAFKLKFNV